MKIQLNTDKNIQGHESMQARVDSMVEHAIGRFYPRLTRIEVHLSDSNANKGGNHDKHCAIEARLEHEEPLGVEHADENIEKAIRGACNKLKSRLESLLERHRGH